jgi:flagellar hook-associated protein 2
MSTTATPLTFHGQSQFASDFQAILTRSVGIAQLPITALQNQQADLLQKKAALIALSPEVGSLGISIGALSSLGSSQGLLASSSNANLVSVVNTGAASAASYSVSNVTSLAAPASETSLVGYASASSGAVSSSGSISLTYGANTYTIALTPATNNLNGLVAAINKLDVGVNATVLNTGTGATPSYLSLSASSDGRTTLQLQDLPATGAPVNLISSTNQGTNATFELNGLPVSKSSNTINDVVPGLTFTLLSTTTTGQTAQLSLKPDSSGLTTALQNFAQNYNALVDQVNGQVGTGAGPLAGNSLIYTISSDLQQLGSYHGSGSVQSLSDLGLTFDSTGQITFDPTAVSAFSGSQLQDAFNFLGSSTSGFGALANNFTQLGDPTTGLILQQENSESAQSTTLTDRINTLNTSLALFQANLTARLTAADVAVSELQNKLSTVNSTVQGLDSVLYGKQTNSNGL